MASILQDIKYKLTPSHSAGESHPPPQQQGEQAYNILPHPAKSNDPADLQQPAERTGGLTSDQGAFSAFTSQPGPVVPDQNTLGNLPPAKTHEELKEAQAQLNSQN